MSLSRPSPKPFTRLGTAASRVVERLEANTGAPDAGRPGVREALIHMIAGDLESGIANLGYPVGMGVAPDHEACIKAATSIVDRVKDQALALLAERAA